MKVVYACSLASGGPLTHLLDLAPHVASLGAEVSVICASDEIAAEFRKRDVDAWAFPLRHKLDVGGTMQLRPTLQHADVVHTHDRRTGLLVRTAARAQGTVCVHTLHGVPDEIFGLVGRPDSELPPGISRVRAAWLRFGLLGIEAALARLGTTVVPSEALRRFLLAHGFPKSRTVVIPNGVELRRSQPEARHELFRIATVGILEYRKGLDVLLEACARVEEALHLDIYGEGTLRASLERLAMRLGVDVTFHGAVADIPERLLETDAFVLATRGDNLPVAVLEAMSVALPVAAARTGGLPELVLDGETGILVEPEDADGLAAAIDRLARDEDLRLRLGRAAAKRVARRFEAGAVAREAVALYGRVSAASS